MRLVLQRVRRASVSTGGAEAARIGPGLVILVGFTAQDGPAALEQAVKDVVELRLFDDERGRPSRSLLETGGEVLVVSEITLVASLAKGRRPSFDPAAPPDAAKALFSAFVDSLKRAHPKVQTGVFQADMIVSLDNDGPVTFVLDY